MLHNIVANQFKRVTVTYFPVLLLTFLWAVLLISAEAQTTEYQEAPQLTELVEAGRLPPVHERLPLNPMVVEPVERIGEYGGTWRTALLGGQDGAWMVRTMAYENLVRWTPDWDGIIPNITESYEINEETTEFTFYLREGLKWSDGYPFTADDIMFWYEDVFLNQEITPEKPAWLVIGNQPVVVEKINDYAVKFVFSEPNGLFLQGLADVRGVRPTSHPRHYFEQFHSVYNRENLDQLVQEVGVTDWVALFTLMGGGSGADIRWWNSELPTLNGWITTVGIGESTSRMVAERNPYYWKVDPEGNQLPYIDRITYDFVESVEVLLLRALAGEIDMMDRHLATPTNRAVLFDNMERGDYHFFSKIPSAPNAVLIEFNLNHPDPVKREIFQNKDFRIGLSHAINRQEIIDLIFVGQGEPHQIAPLRESRFYHEQLAKQYTEYDADLANEYLDRAGYSERDSEGFRLGPDGRRITFAVDVYTSYQTVVDSMELVQNYWRDVGINMLLRPGDRSLVATRVGNADFDVHATLALDGGAGETVITAPGSYFPFSFQSHYALAWASWYFNPSGGGDFVSPEEPPTAAKRQMGLYDQLKVTGDPVIQAELMNEILDIAADQFYVMGITTEPEGYGIVRNNFHNVPERMFDSYSWPTPAASNPVQYFIRSQP